MVPADEHGVAQFMISSVADTDDDKQDVDDSDSMLWIMSLFYVCIWRDFARSMQRHILI